VEIQAASWKALDIFYNYHEKINPNLNGNVEGLLARLFMGNLHNRQSVTNRYKLVHRILTEAITHCSNGDGDGVRVISISDGGLFLTCNIHKNSEKPFLDWAVLWPMIYRDEQEFADLLIEGGFAPEKIQIIYEPFRIHGIAVCRK
jgi:hypothetical protein